MNRLEAGHSDTGIAIEPLTIENVHHLRLGWTSRFDRSDVRNIVETYPGLSQWIPETGEYLIASPWRHRSEISSVLELSARQGAAALLHAFAGAAEANGKRVALMSEHQETRNPRLYELADFALLEHIMIYELPSVSPVAADRFQLQFEEVPIWKDDALWELIELDHASFPWLWWNSREEFLSYGRARGVKIYGGWDGDGELVSYVGLTRFRAWGHLDRIAVHPEKQGRGIGLESLEWAVHVLALSGATRIGLSTQGRNERSRWLYERYGFRRSPQQDYFLYGHWLSEVPEQVRPI